MDGILGEMKLIVDKQQQMYDHRTVNNLGDSKMSEVKTWHQFNIGDSVFIETEEGFREHKVKRMFATIGGKNENVTFEVERKGVVSQVPFDKVFDADEVKPFACSMCKKALRADELCDLQFSYDYYESVCSTCEISYYADVRGFEEGY